MSQIQATDNPKLLIILGPPRSFTTVVSTMLGQHPEMYGLPETHLFGDNIIKEWWERAAAAPYPMADGLLRATAQIIFGEQTEETVRRASGWLQRRADCATGYLLELFLQQLGPLMLVEKSPSTVFAPDLLWRAYEMFPRAKFMHLLRHPRGYGESVVKAFHAAQEHGPVPRWLLRLTRRPSPFGGGQLEYDFDPQKSWYALNMNISNFLQRIPNEQKLRIQGEQILTEPDRMLAQVCAWLGVSQDPEAIEEMKHPERSPYACLGPANARFGNDDLFLADPVLRPARASSQSLEGPLGWRDDGQEFVTEVRELAAEFGYA
jgi:hypothetical protein